MFRKLFNLIFGTNFGGVVDLTPEEKTLTPKPTPIKKPYTISQVGIDLIKKWEGCKLKAYKDTGGVWTIGYGTIADVKEGMTITLDQAEKVLKSYLLKQDATLNKLLEGVDLLSQEQFDAISSLVYNIGITQFSTSTLLANLKQTDWPKAANQLIRRDSKGVYHGWIYDNGKKIEGLINRRKAEKELFLRGSIV